jgi:uncharacterized membrane protein YqjE
MTAVDSSEPSLGELFGELGSDLSTLLRKEVELAKVEAREEARRLTRATTFGIVAGVAALLALVILSLALAWWIDEGLNTAVAFAIVGAIWTIVAAATAAIARTEMSRIRPLPETADGIKGAVTGERAIDEPRAERTGAAVLSPTHQIRETRHTDKETAS